MNPERRRFLLAMWEGGGTVPPELGVAKRLLAQGHQVHVVADPTIAADATALGCSFSSWNRAPHRKSLDTSEDLLRDWEISNPLAMLKRVRDRFLAGPAADFAADTTEQIAAFAPDAVVADALLFGTVMAAKAAAVPVAALVPNIWMFPTRGTPSIGPGFPPAKSVIGRTRDAALLAVTNRLFNKALPQLNSTRATYGLAPLTSFYDQVLEADRILVLSSSAFDFASPFVPSNVRYVGPILDEPAWAEPWASPWDDESDPLVLVGFSSTFQNQGPLLQRIVDALSTLPVRAVVTLGQMLGDHDIATVGNVRVVRSAPHGPILQHAALAITHCGHGTTMKALAAAVPMVCVPMGRDQNDTAARVAHAGAGVRLSPNASTDAIRGAIRRVLGDDRYRANATALSSAIADECRASELVDELQRLADARRRNAA